MKKNKILLLLSFFTPAAIFLVIFAVCGLSPFGGKDIFISDMGDQYYPFISDYLHRIKGGHSLFWSWSLGGGTDYLTMFAYYLSSPLNLILLLVPESVLPEALSFLIVFKIGLAGLFMGMFLMDCSTEKSATHNNGVNAIPIPLFATFYALSSFAVLFYWNIIWLDAFALLPLVILGETALIREGKFKLYIITLSLSIITNFYMGFYTCVFVAITFFGQCYIQKLPSQEFKRKLTLIAVHSAIAIGITALLTLPSYIYLTNMASTSDYGFPDSITFTHIFSDIIGNVLAFSSNVTDINYYMPNLYCGIFCLILAGPYFGLKEIKLREKIVFGVTVIFMLISFNTIALDYIWNAFRYVNGLPFRYMHLLFFTVIAAAYRSFTVIYENGAKRRDLISIIVVAVVVLWAATTTIQAPSVLPNAAFIAGYILIFAILGTAYDLKNIKTKVVLSYICLAAIIATGLSEMSINAYKTIEDNTSSAEGDDYFDSYAAIKALLNTIDTPSSDFYRVEVTTQYENNHMRQFNNPVVFGYNGLSVYSSTSVEAMAQFYQKFGLPITEGGVYNYSSYGHMLSSPLSAMFLNLRYLISDDNAIFKGDVFWEVKNEMEGRLLLENGKYLPLGFMVNRDVLDYTTDSTNPFITQNNMFSAATGLDDNLFTLMAPSEEIFTNYTIHSNADGIYIFTITDMNHYGSFHFEYETPADGVVYTYINNSAEVTAETSATTLELNNLSPHITSLGKFTKDETIHLNAAMTEYNQSVNGFIPIFQDWVAIYAAVMDEELFSAGYDILADETLKITKFQDTYIRGEITALADGLLYTSIPLSDNWTAYVDGKKAEVKPINGAFAGVLLTAGEHIIEFRYFNKPFAVGIVISLISLGAFMVMWRGLPRRLGRVSAPWAPNNDDNNEAEPVARNDETIETEPVDQNDGQ